MHIWTINDDPGTSQPKVFVYTNQKDPSMAQSNYKLNLKSYQSYHKDAQPPVDGTIQSIEYVGFCPLPQSAIRALASVIIP